tara:strand:+ start:1780 stop:1929 length:150 start_codon:yes stop_codon:yes gene_type:complete
MEETATIVTAKVLESTTSLTFVIDWKIQHPHYTPTGTGFQLFHIPTTKF